MIDFFDVHVLKRIAKLKTTTILILFESCFRKSNAHMLHVQSDPLNSYSLNSPFLLNLSGKFENFESINDTNVKLPS